MAGDDHNAAAKAWRKMIKEWPDEPAPYHNLAVVLKRSSRFVEAAPILLKAMELREEGTEDWAEAAATAFGLLKLECCDEVPKPEWWNDEALKALSARVVALAPDHSYACNMRARVLAGDTLSDCEPAPWNSGPRTSAEIKEAATWYRRAALLARTPAGKLLCEGLGLECDETALLWSLLDDQGLCDICADRLLTKEEAEAAEARAAAAAEEAEALKVAEAKAATMAEELLAEEEQEKQAASKKASKAKQSKGKKGKGNR